MSLSTGMVRVSQSHEQARSRVPPGVFVNGYYDPRLYVTRIKTQGILAEESAELVMCRMGRGVSHQERRVVDAYIGKVIEIVQPISLGVETRMLPLMKGSARPAVQELREDRDQFEILLVSEWVELLNEAIERRTLDNLQPTAGWCLKSMIEVLNARFNLSLNLELLPIELLNKRVHLEMISGRLLKNFLQSLGEHFQFYVQHERKWDGNRIIETRYLRPNEYSRPVKLNLNTNRHCGSVQRLSGEVNEDRPVKVVGICESEVVESTFELVRGWDTSLEGAADTQYAKSTSDDFESVRNVYRLWVLNEDRAFSSNPFMETSHFDAAGVFDEPVEAESYTTPFLDTLTKDESGASRGVIVEISLDEGETWQHYPGRMNILRERGGVYFDDSELPEDYMDACKTGEAVVRVTCSLQNPTPTKRFRAKGNPFMGPFRTHQYESGSIFKYRHVHAGSQFYERVMNGELDSDAIDQRDDCLEWLNEVAMRMASVNDSLEIRYGGMSPGLRIGDQLSSIENVRMGHGLEDTAVRGERYRLDQIEIDYRKQESTLVWKGG